MKIRPDCDGRTTSSQEPTYVPLATDLGRYAMCGLTVFVSSRPAAGTPDPATTAAFAAALETMHHRGPDDTQVEFADGVAFGFKRLAIIDREHAAQPVHYSDRWTVVFNGEIYNYRRLRLELIREH